MLAPENIENNPHVRIRTFGCGNKERAGLPLLPPDVVESLCPFQGAEMYELMLTNA